MWSLSIVLVLMSDNQQNSEEMNKLFTISYLKSQKLDCVDGPVHVVLDPLVQLGEVFLGYDVVGVEIQDVVEKVFELVLLEARQ